MTRLGVSQTRAVLTCFLLCLAAASTKAQARTDFSATGGLGVLNTGLGSHTDRGLALQFSVGLPISASLSVAPHVGYWKEGNAFVAAAPELRWTPRAQPMLRLSAGLGMGWQQVTFLTTIEPPDDGAGTQFLTSVVGTAAAGIALPITASLQPMIEVRMTSMLRRQEDRDAGYGNATLIMVGIGLRYAR